MTSSELYWLMREERQRKKDLLDEISIQEKIDSLGETLIQEINAELDAFYMKYAKANGLTMAEAKKKAETEDIAGYALKAAKFASEGDFSDEAIKCIDQYELTAKTSRLDLLMMSINAEMAKTTAETQKIITDALSGRGAEEIERQASVYGKTVFAVGTRVQTLVKASFQGAAWSYRLWSNQKDLRESVGKCMRAYLVRGISTTAMMDDMKKKLWTEVENASYCARRILVTERQRVAGQAQMEAYKSAGIKYYQFVAEPGCCKICEGLDGKKIKVEDGEPGVNLRPVHPNCRCQTIGVNAGTDEDFDEWADSLGAHEMAYDDWIEVKDSPEYSGWIDGKDRHGLTYEEYLKYATGNDTNDFELWEKTYTNHGMEFKDWKAEVTKAEKKVATAEKYLKNFDKKTYSNIWFEDVTEEDYSAKKGAIKKKIEYFEDKLFFASTEHEKQKFQDLLDSVKEFQKNGKRYASGQTRLKNAKQQLRKLTYYLDVGGDAYTQERKDNAAWAKSPREADKFFRKTCGDVWRTLSRSQKHALYDYTSGSGKFNRPLSGFEKNYYDSGSGWEAKFKKGVKNVWINFEGAGDEIRAMTEAISKSSYTEDVWVQRGCDYDAMESFFDLPFGTLSSYSQDELDNLIGSEERMYSFTSCGDSKGKGFDHKPIILNVYVPAGTNCFYAEPFSCFGRCSDESWDGKQTQNSFGNEAEVIIQRGAKYRVVKIEKTPGKLYMDLEVHPECGYDTYQQDDSEWTGSRKVGR